jgi:N-acylglucosamine-6-phosphate 2-epimerase
MEKGEILRKIKGGLIVSCQALEDEPLHSSFIMAKMAYAAMLGGAVGIRCNSGEDIREIKKTVKLPIIGLSKKLYKGYSVFITPTMREVKEVVEAGAHIVAIDATDRKRPDNLTLKEFFIEIKKQYPKAIIMGDISTVEEGVMCESLGFDLVSTTLRGYTEDTKDIELPDFNFLSELLSKLSIPVIAEGGIWTPEQLRRAMEIGAYSAVIGTAITRPMEITKRFVSVIK